MISLQQLDLNGYDPLNLRVDSKTRNQLSNKKSLSEFAKILEEMTLTLFMSYP
jgi:hypothetical protein